MNAPAPIQPTDLLKQAENTLFWANSYSRADALVELFNLGHPRRLALLGEAWSCCDCFPDEMVGIVQYELPRPCMAAMTPAERELYRALPEILTIYRGAYAANAIGMCWSLDLAVAARFPTLPRYIGEGRPILVHGTVQRELVAFVKLDREEQEIVCSPEDVNVQRVEYLKGGRQNYVHRWRPRA